MFCTALLLLVSTGEALRQSQWTNFTSGSLNLIIVAPHGGHEEPETITPRGVGGCPYGVDQCAYCHNGCERDESLCLSKDRPDQSTQELAYELADAIESITGSRPFVIANLLHRNRLDANRDPNEATFGELDAVDAWFQFHKQIQEAKLEVLSEFGFGLVVDIHGQNHEELWIELGYDHSGDDLDELTSEEMNTQGTHSSLRSLSRAWARMNISYEQIMRGENSLGAFLNNYVTDYRTVPSPNNPGPNGGNYFSGGYDIEVHGSQFDDRPIDSLQIEVPFVIRNNETRRTEFAEEFANSLLDFMNIYYDGSVLEIDPNLGRLKVAGDISCISHTNCSYGLYYCANDGTCRDCNLCLLNRDSIDGGCFSSCQFCSFSSLITNLSMDINQWLNHVYDNQSLAEIQCNSLVDCQAVISQRNKYYLMPRTANLVTIVNSSTSLRDCTISCNYLQTLDTGVTPMKDTISSGWHSMLFATKDDASSICNGLVECIGVISLPSQNLFSLMHVSQDFIEHADSVVFLKACDPMYKYYTKALTWPEAEQQCVRDGGHLVGISSQRENDLVIEICDPTGSSYCWVGLTRQLNFSSSNISWVWADDLEAKNTIYEGWDYHDASSACSAGAYCNWRPNSQPAGDDEECAAMRNNVDPPGTWYDRPCSNTTHDYVCEFGHCFLSEEVCGIDMVRTRWATFVYSSKIEAQDVCQHIAHCLAVILRADQLFYLMPTYTNFTTNNSSSAFIKICADSYDATATELQTMSPSDAPSGPPSDAPSGSPSKAPTQASLAPTGAPTSTPIEQPPGPATDQPSEELTNQPTIQTTNQPTNLPTNQPTGQPTDHPTGEPTAFQTLHNNTAPPTYQPTDHPTGQPTAPPTFHPTDTAQPTYQPTGHLTGQPTSPPTFHDTTQPTYQPTAQLTEIPAVRHEEEEEEDSEHYVSCAPFIGSWMIGHCLSCISVALWDLH